MQSTFFIIPGWQETCRRKCYRDLGNVASSKKYNVVYVKVDWKKPLSKQLFEVSPKDIIFGFSLGAILARLVCQKYECKKVFYASSTPLKYFTDKKLHKDLAEVTGMKFVIDIQKHLIDRTCAKKEISLYGDKEEGVADIKVKNTGHNVSSEYIEAIKNLI